MIKLRIVSDNVPITIFCVHLDCEASGITGSIGRSALATDS
jgi:hypothetical protein